MNYAEPAVARVVGVNKRTLVNTRQAQLTKGEHWVLEQNVVCYTDAGLEKLLGALGLARAAFAWPSAAGEGEDGDDIDGEALEASEEQDEASEQPALVAPEPEKFEVGPTCPPPPIGLPGVPVEDDEEPEASTVVEQVKAAILEIETRPVVELIVQKLSNNPSLLHAKTDKGAPVLVRVANNVNFTPGMKLKARAPAKDEARPVFMMIGHCPRWRGRW